MLSSAKSSGAFYSQQQLTVSTAWKIALWEGHRGPFSNDSSSILGAEAVGCDEYKAAEGWGSSLDLGIITTAAWWCPFDKLPLVAACPRDGPRTGRQMLLVLLGADVITCGAVQSWKPSSGRRKHPEPQDL